jgi:hypothetical protein
MIASMGDGHGDEPRILSYRPQVIIAPKLWPTLKVALAVSVLLLVILAVTMGAQSTFWKEHPTPKDPIEGFQVSAYCVGMIFAISLVGFWFERRNHWVLTAEGVTVMRGQRAKASIPWQAVTYMRVLPFAVEIWAKVDGRSRSFRVHSVSKYDRELCNAWWQRAADEGNVGQAIACE